VTKLSHKNSHFYQSYIKDLTQIFHSNTAYFEEAKKESINIDSIKPRIIHSLHRRRSRALCIPLNSTSSKVKTLRQKNIIQRKTSMITYLV